MAPSSFKVFVRRTASNFSKLRIGRRRPTFGGHLVIETNINDKILFNGILYEYIVTRRCNTVEEGYDNNCTLYEISCTDTRCFSMEVCQGDTEAYIREISKYDGCINPDPVAKFGMIFIQIAMKLLKKYEAKIEIITLQDEAMSFCGYTGKKSKMSGIYINRYNSVQFSLSYMLLLCKGIYYYETIGLKPVNKRTFIEYNKEHVNRLKYKDISDVLEKLELVPGEYFGPQTSVKTIFTYLFKHDCENIAQKLQELFTEIGLKPTQGLVFYAKVQ